MPRTPEMRRAPIVAALLGAALLALGCSDSRLTTLGNVASDLDGRVGPSDRFTYGVTRIDLLLVVDDSSGMIPVQKALVGALGPLLQELTASGLDWRLGVISSDLGIAPYAGPGCDGSGKGASLQSTARLAGCVAPKERWLSSTDGGDPSAALGCIATLGDGGCGFERPLQAALLALDPAKEPASNQGFLRDGAGLLVVFVSNEDDCSAKDAALYDPDAIALGPWASYRCFGHDVGCKGSAPDGSLVGCTSGQGKHLLPVNEAAASLQKLRPGGMLAVILLVGPPEPVRLGKGRSGEVELEVSCSAQGFSARPAIRLSELGAALGSTGRRASICEPALLRAPLSEAIAELRRTPYHCLRYHLVDPARPRCSVEVTGSDGRSWSVPPSAPGSPGFRLIHPIEAGCDTGALSFEPAVAPPVGASVELRCDFMTSSRPRS